MPAARTTESEFEASRLPDTAIGREIFAFLREAHFPPDKAERREGLTALNELKQHPGEVVETLRKAYVEAPSTDYAARWDLIWILGEIREGAALEVLETVAQSELPPESQPREGEGGTSQEELRIRMSAVEGIAFLAAERNDAAARSLRALIETDLASSIRAMAVRRYLDLGSEKRNAELRRVLPSRDHWMLDPESHAQSRERKKA